MRVEPIPYEPRDGADYARELDEEAFRSAVNVRDKLRVINDVSYLEIGETVILYNLYAEVAERRKWHLPAIEIGSRFGCSTLTLALAIREHGGEQLVSIDPHGYRPAGGHHVGSLDILCQNLRAARLQAHVALLLARSDDVAKWWSYPLGLVFIDGAHDTQSVMNDLRLFDGLIELGGILCGHDYQTENDSVKSAVDSYAAQVGVDVAVEQSIWSIRM